MVDHPTSTAARPVAQTVDALVGPEAERRPLLHSDSKSGAVLEWAVVDGRRLVLKHLDLRQDWTMRAVGDVGCGTLMMWQAGLFDRMPDCFRQPILGIASDPDAWPAGADTWVLMEDVSEFLVPPGDDPIPLDLHLSFIDHMTALHAAFWEAGPEIDIVPAANRLMELSPWLAVVEGELGSDHVVPGLVGKGWQLIETVAPEFASVVVPLAWDPTPLAAALATTPSTLVHGNWKLGNLGHDHQGRTVLFDWENPGRGSGCAELAWYLAINSARLPCSREDTIDAYREGLERRGVPVDGWWDRQLALGMLAGAVWFGWEKAFGGWGPELEWWTEWVDRARAHLD